MTPLQLLEQEQKNFVEEYRHQRAISPPTKSNHQVILAMLENGHWKRYANIGTYEGARKLLNRMLPGWSNKPKTENL